MNDEIRAYGQAIFDLAKNDNQEHIFKKQLDDINISFETSEEKDNFLQNISQELFVSFETVYLGFNEVYREKYEVVSLEIISAFPLSNKVINQITEQVKTITQRDVSNTITIDQNLIGGVILKFDDRIVDSSIKTKLMSFSKTDKGGEL